MLLDLMFGANLNKGNKGMYVNKGNKGIKDKGMLSKYDQILLHAKESLLNDTKE